MLAHSGGSCVVVGWTEAEGNEQPFASGWQECQQCSGDQRPKRASQFHHVGHESLQDVEELGKMMSPIPIHQVVIWQPLVQLVERHAGQSGIGRVNDPHVES